MRFLALLTACAVVAAVDAVDPCKRQPFRGRCPSRNGESPKRSQFVLRYYMRNGECVSYPYGHCASDESEPQLYRYKEECEDACINPPPANLGAPKNEFEQTYGTSGPIVNGVQTDQRSPSATSTTTQVPSTSAMSEATTTSAIAETTATSTRAIITSEAPSSSPDIPAKAAETARSTTAEAAPSTAEVPQKEEEVASKVTPGTSAEAPATSSTTTVASTTEEPSTTKSVTTTTTTTPKAPITTTTEISTTPTTTTRRSTYTRTTVRTTTVQADNTSRSSVTRATTTAPRTECERRRATAASSTIRGGFVPVCTSQGAFEKVQCEPDGRQCFCVDSRGIEVANSRTRNGQKPDCDGIQSSSVPRTKECVGGAVRGPCSATMNRWYYDEQEAKCNRFSYSGCGGNGNNYDSEEACIQRCAPPPMGLPKCEKGEPLKTKLGVTVNCAKSDCPYGYKCSIVQQTSVCCPENNKIIGLQTSASTDVCSLPKERGPCDKYELRFYFNAELKECKYFFWGGCEGNGNNFEKVEECESTCGIAKARENIPTTPRPAQSNRPHSFRTTQGIRITPGTFTRSEEAAVPHESHTTATSAPSRTATASRRTFTSGATTSSESAAAETSTQHTAAAAAAAAAAVHVAATRAPPVSEMALLEGSEDSSADSVNRCLHPKDPGNCRGQFIRWYWDSERKLCDVFTYTGCQGNGNNYASREECLAICHKEATPLVVNDFSTVCKHDVDAGECNGVFQRFAFDTESSECRPFTYGGCGGNGNNFATLAECRIKCQKVALSPGNLCEHDIEVGECSGVFVRFGYDKSNNDCRQFTYGGCGGNGNNFATIQECRNVCVKKVCNPNPQCDLARCQIVNDRNGCPFCSCPPLDQPSPPGAGQCPEVDAEKCIEPCIVINNRKGCKDCVCPTMPGGGSQPPASFDRPVSPPSPQNEDPTPRPALSSARPPASPSNVGPPSGSRRDSADNHLHRQESSVTAHSSQRKQIETDSRQLLPPPLSAHLHEKCMQPVEPGPCKHFVDRWFFHAEDGTCHPFKYGGCAGNRNHFFSQNECEIHCARFLHRVTVPSTPLHVHENPTAILEEKQPTKQHDDRQPDRLEPLARHRPPPDTLPSSVVARPHSIHLDPHSPATSDSMSTSRPATAVRLPFDLPASVRAHAIRNVVPESNGTPSLATTPYYPETYEAWDFNLSRHKELEKTTSVPQATTAAPLHTSQLVHEAATNDAHTTVAEKVTVTAIAPQRNSQFDRSSFLNSASLHPSEAEPKANRLPLQEQIPVKLLLPLAEQVRPRTDVLTPSSARSTAPKFVKRIGEHPVNASIKETQQHQFIGAAGQSQLPRQQSVATHPHVYKMNSIGDYNPQQNNNLAGLSPPVDPTYFTYNSQHLGGAGKRQFAVNSVPFGGQMPLTLSNWNQPARAMAPQTFAFAGPDQQELQPARQVFQAIEPQMNASPTPAGGEEQVLIGGQVFRSMQPQSIASQSPVQSMSASGAAGTGPNQATHHSQFNFRRVSNSEDTVRAGHLGIQNGAGPLLSLRAPDQREASSSIPFQAATDSSHIRQMSQHKPLTSDRSGPLDQEKIAPIHLQSNHWQAPSPREVARASSTSSESRIRAQLHSDEGVGQEGGAVVAPSGVLPSREGETSTKSTVQVEARPPQRIRIEPVRREPDENGTRPPHDQIQTQASKRNGALQGNPELSHQDNRKVDSQFLGQNRPKEPFTPPPSGAEEMNLQWRPPQNHHTSDRRVVYMNDQTQPQRSSFPRRTIENNRMVVSSQQNVASAVEQDILKTKNEWERVKPQNSSGDAKKGRTENSKAAHPTVDSARAEFPANFDRSKFIYYNGDYYAPTIPGIRVPRPDLVQPGEGPLLPSEEAPTAEMFREFQRRSKEFQSAAPLVKGGRSTTNDNAVHILDKSLYMKQQASVVSAPPVRLPDKRSRLVSNDGEDGDGDDEGVPRRAAGVTQSHRREPIGVENYPAPVPTLRGVLQTHVAHGKKIAKIPVIHVDSMMSTSSVEAPEDNEVTRTDRPPTITGQRVSRITLRPPTSTEAPRTASTTTRSTTTTTTTVGTSPSTAAQSPGTESTIVAGVSQTSNITTESLSTDATTPQEVDAQPNTVTVSATTEESAARRVSTVDHTLPEFIRTSATPEIAESTTEANEEEPQRVHPTRDPVSETSPSQTDTAVEDTYLRTTTEAPEAFTSTSTSTPVADSAAESTTSVDLSVILSTAFTLSSTNGRVVTATEASTSVASPSNTGTLAPIKAIAPSEATTVSTTLRSSVDADNSILNSTTLSTPLPTKEPHVAATVANSIDHFAKVYKSSENETVEFFDPDDLPPPPPENERRPVMSLAPRIAGESIKPLKKIEILPKSVITAASPTTTTPVRTTGAPASTSTYSPSAASPEDDLTEIEGLSSFEVSSSEDMAGYSVGREPVPLSPIGIGRNMERLDLDGLEEPTTIIPPVLMASTSVKADTDATSTATPAAEIQQTTAAAEAITAERITTEALTKAATTGEQKLTSTTAPAAMPSTTWSPPTESPTTTPSAPPTTTTLSPPTAQTSRAPAPVAAPAATTAPPSRRALARGETQKGAVEFDARVVCSLPPDVGTCFDYVPRWFFNAQSSQCEQFSYGSCGGNENNFADRNVCELKCMSAHTSVLSHVPERCTYERDGGFGKGYNVKWYFNMKNLRCEQFVYEGRGGNDNQFETLSDCERTCSPQPGLSSRVKAPPTVTLGPPPEQELRPNTVPTAPLPDKQTIEDILDYDEKLSQFVEDSEAAIPATHTPSVSNSIDNRVIISQAPVAPLPPVPEVVRSPGSQPRPPAVQAAKTVVHREKAPEGQSKAVTLEKKKEIYKAEPLPEKPPATGNEGLPIVGASPPMSVNYQTGEVKTKASGIRTFQESSSKVVVEDSDLTEGGEHRRDSLSCPNGLQEIRYADGRPVMCLPGKNQCPERSVCFFNGVDFFCCPNEEDPYDKHVFGGYDGEETKHGYKVFGPLNIRRLMDEVPLRVRRSTEAIRRRRQASSSSAEHVPSSFNIDSITAPLRFDDEKPRQVSRALRMRAKPAPPHHGNPICIEPLSQGDCGAAHLRYFYDRDTDKCRLFYYSGCKGNSNNFGSLLDCQRLCVLGGQRLRPESASSSPPILRGQCPGGKTPLGGSAPVLCGNTTDSIGCPVGFYCLPGPPDVCCPNSAVKSEADKESVRFAPEIPGVPRAHSRQTFLATPKFMCPDASDPLMGPNNEPTTCGAGFDGLKLCPKGFYCAIDVEKQSRMCCPLYGAAERVPTEQVVAPYLGRRPSNPGEVIERGSLPFDQGDLTSRAVNKHEMDEINNRKRAKVPVFETTASPFEDESEETMEDGEDEEDGMAHLMLKPADPSSESADSSTSPPASIDEHAIDLPTDPPPVEESPAVKEFTDKSVCQIRPSEGRACREDEKPPRTNLHYFYSPKDRRCKLYFYRGCGGNANRFEKKIDCEQLCLP